MRVKRSKRVWHIHATERLIWVKGGVLHARGSEHYFLKLSDEFWNLPDPKGVWAEKAALKT